MTEILLLIVVALGFAAALPYVRALMDRWKPTSTAGLAQSSNERMERRGSSPDFVESGTQCDASHFLRGIQLVSIIALAALLIPWLVAVGRRRLDGASFGAAFVMTGVVLIGLIPVELLRRTLASSRDEPADASVGRAASDGSPPESTGTASVEGRPN